MARAHLDKSHGFLQDIINNQFTRKVFDVEQNAQKEEARLNAQKRVEEEIERKKNARRQKREAVPTMSLYIPPSQRQVVITPPRYVGRTVFRMEVEFRPNKFATLKSESIARACQLFVSRYDMSPDHIPTLEFVIMRKMGLEEELD
eukprot:sb/3473841/